MNIILRFKNRKKLDKRGFSSIVGAIFMILIVSTLASSFFLFTLSQNSAYNDAVRERNQLDVNRISENIYVVNVNYSVSANNNVSITAKIQNTGPSSIQFVTIWFYVSNNTWANYNYANLTLTIKGGATYSLYNSTVVNGVSLTGSYDVTSWLITTRGNTISLPKQPAITNKIIVAQLAQGIGSMALDFSAFRFFEYATSTGLASYSDGIKSFNVPSGTNIAFGALLTNLDPSEQTIILDKYSQLWLYFPQSPGQTRLWYVVNVDSIGNIASSYSPISIAYMETKLIVFASSAAGSFSSGSRVSILHPDDTGALNLLLLGTIGPRDYGQNIPFVALYVRP